MKGKELPPTGKYLIHILTQRLGSCLGMCDQLQKRNAYAIPHQPNEFLLMNSVGDRSQSQTVFAFHTV